VLNRSTEADDYSCNLSQDACLRTLLVNRVVVGRPYRRYRNAPDLVKPPDGFDSVGYSLFNNHLLISLQVTGEIGWDLNHEGEFRLIIRLLISTYLSYSAQKLYATQMTLCVLHILSYTDISPKIRPSQALRP
jgi:hypothetical protein